MSWRKRRSARAITGFMIGMSMAFALLVFGPAQASSAQSALPIYTKLTVKDNKTEAKVGELVTFHLKMINFSNRAVGKNLRVELRFFNGTITVIKPHPPEIVEVSQEKVTWQLEGKYGAHATSTFTLQLRAPRFKQPRMMCVHPDVFTSQDDKYVNRSQSKCVKLLRR